MATAWSPCRSARTGETDRPHWGDGRVVTPADVTHFGRDATDLATIAEDTNLILVTHDYAGGPIGKVTQAAIDENRLWVHANRPRATTLVINQVGRVLAHLHDRHGSTIKALRDATDTHVDYLVDLDQRGWIETRPAGGRVVAHLHVYTSGSRLDEAVGRPWIGDLTVALTTKGRRYVLTGW